MLKVSECFEGWVNEHFDSCKGLQKSNILKVVRCDLEISAPLVAVDVVIVHYDIDMCAHVPLITAKIIQ